MRILGIDPGSTSMGFAVIEADDRMMRPLVYGTTALKAADLPGKLLLLRKQTAALLKKHNPDCVGIEKLFFAKNKKTALEVAQARGAVLVTLQEAGIAIFEFTPAEVKIAVTNYGAADKIMVRSMVCKLLNLPSLSGDDNASDALAVAITTCQAAGLQGRL